ncbi:MAG: adenylate/guanylate cyclase domain-containing protein [Ignavibacteriaceae bacterium]|jgi:class 3 adenylate cyclase/AmiR/NasT family two-component response regulator
MFRKEVSNFSIVIVDDFLHSRIILQRRCHEYGFKKISAYESGKDFIEGCLCLNDKPDFVLMDFHMPKMNGVEAFLEAKGIELFGETIFIAVTAYAGSGDRPWLLALGFEECCFKPIDSEELIKTIESFLINDSTKKSPRKLTDILRNTSSEMLSLRINQMRLQKDYIYKLIPEKIYKELEKSPEKLIPRLAQVGVGFVDIREFTHLTNILPVDELNEVITSFFSLCAEIIEDNDCFLDKFIGDAVMWFSVSDSEKNSAKSVIDTAVQIIDNITLLNKKIIRKLFKNININVGIGLACGSATVGLLGAPDYRIQYSVLGPPVNLASRFCSNAKINEIIIGGKIIDYCDYKYEKLGFVSVKGFEYDIEAVKLLLE